MSLFEVLSQPVDEAKVLETFHKRAAECRMLARETIEKARKAERKEDRRYYTEQACFWRKQAAQAMPTALALLGKSR